MLIRGSINGTVAPFATVLLIQAGLAPALLGPVAALAAIATLVAAPTWAGSETVTDGDECSWPRSWWRLPSRSPTRRWSCP